MQWEKGNYYAFEEYVLARFCFSLMAIFCCQKNHRILKKQSNGALLVIQELHEEDDKKTGNKISGISIHSCDLQSCSEKFIETRDAIDGALVVDARGNCQMVGGILHSSHGSEGNPGRGSRYNSAIAYREALKNQGKACIVIVYSEDRCIDVLTTDD